MRSGRPVTPTSRTEEVQTFADRFASTQIVAFPLGPEIGIASDAWPESFTVLILPLIIHPSEMGVPSADWT